MTPRNTRILRTLLAAIATSAALAIAPPGPLAPQQAPDRRANAVRDYFVAELARFERATAALVSAVSRTANTPASLDALRQAFTDARLAYKRIEFFVEYYAGPSALQLNGPPIDEVELEGGPPIIIPASGFQVLEGLVFPRLAPGDRAEALKEARAIHDVVPYLRGLAPTIPMRDVFVFDAFRLEVARISVMGLVGFDSPVLRTSTTEAAAAIEGIRQALRPYQQDLQRRDAKVARRLDSLMTAAQAYLTNTTFDRLNRLAFITVFANPMASTIAEARDALRIPIPSEARFWRARAATLFEPGAFDAEALRAPGLPEPSEPAVALGEKLFSEVAMSGGGTRSCASCHDPKRAFIDGLPSSPSLIHGRKLRNSPTLLNAALQRMQFADMRTAYLEDQVEAVVENDAEMRGALETTAMKLVASADYRRRFTAAFPQMRDTAISPVTIRVALAEYVRSLNRLDSKVDRALRGDTTALDAEERLGFNLFAGKALCATCHFLPLTNSVVPPVYERSEQEVLGVPVAPVWHRATVDPDSGRIVVTRAAMHRFAFKTPTVRNAGVTAPYMHNGVYKTLDDVVRFYDAGGGVGIGIDLPNQTLPPDSLRLTAQEKRALVRFMQALTDTASKR
jgi:cytochrome c peroxidase